MEKYDDLSFDEHDELINPKPDENDFDRVVDMALSRRDLFKGVIAFGGIAALGNTLLPSQVVAAADRFSFTAIATSTEDAIAVPDGFNSQVVSRWGDPLWSSGAEFDHATRGTAADQEMAFGDNNDGMEMYSDGDKTVLIANNEYTNKGVIWGNHEDGKAASDDDILKGKMAHGLTIVELKQDGDAWSMVKDSPYNRRVTPDTEMEVTGPAAGHDLMKTNVDPTGTLALGTFNNCGNGSTPWGTYLACEENFNGYFATADEEFPVTPEQKRYGVSPKGRGYGWHEIDDRFDMAKESNEANRHGYVTEVNALDPNSKPKKRTALGRFKHENAEVVVNGDGRIVVYMGDDERGEFLYRFVSDGVYAPLGETDSLLTDGTLYAAKFYDNGSGEWLELSEEATGMSKAEISMFTRMAASKVGATTMDRPEWVSANPKAAEVYCCLTNNKNRGLKPNPGGDETPVGGPNPREANNYGQIVRWRPAASDHTSNDFSWDLYVLAGNPSVHTGDLNAGSENVNADNMFNSPDGLKFDSNGLLWIQTDGNYSNEKGFAGQGNNQMLAGDPATGEIRRFLVGPKQAEVTGLTWSPDRKTMFVGIQHPGERGEGNWPDGGDLTPRSAIIAVRRDDGGLVG